MRQFNEKALQKYIDDFQEIFKRFNIIEVRIDFSSPLQAEGTAFFIQPSHKAGDVRREIMNVFRAKKLRGIVYVHGNRAFGQEIKIPEDAVDFNELFEKVRGLSKSVTPIATVEHSKLDFKIEVPSKSVKGGSYARCNFKG